MSLAIDNRNSNKKVSNKNNSSETTKYPAESYASKDFLQSYQLKANSSKKQTQLAVLQKKANNTGLPENVKNNTESISGISLDDVKVNYNSNKPAQLNAHAYAEGSNIHVAPGQEKHIGHEAWHVVQQKQGRVKPTTEVGGVPINDNKSLESEADKMGEQTSKEDTSKNKIQLKEKSKGNSVAQLATESQEQMTGGISIKERKAMLALNGLTDGGKIIEKAKANKQTDEIAPELDTPDVQALVKNSDEDGTIRINDRSELKKSKLSVKEAVAMIISADDVVGNVITAGGDASSLYTAVTESNISDTDKNVEQAFGRTDSMITNLFGTTTKKLMDVVTSFVLPAKNAIVAGLTLKSKKDQSKVFKEAARVANAEKTENVENHGPSEFSEMLKYAIGKIWYGIKTQIWKIIKNVSVFVNNLLLIIPSPAQPVAAIIKTGQKIMDATLAAAGWLKKGYQKAFGQKKIKNANYILDSALAGDQKALKLIFDLKLGSVAGTGVGKFDWIMQKLGIIFDPVNGMSGDRVVDLIGVGGPKDVNQLHEFLKKVSSNGASRKFLISDLAEAMTGTGTSF